MHERHSHLIAITYICIAVVGVMLALKLRNQDFGFTFKGIKATSTVNNAEVEADASFFVPFEEEVKSMDNDEINDNPADGNILPSTASSRSAPKVVKRSGPKAYLVGNIATGKIYLESNSSKVLPVASMSKLITALAATDSMPPSIMIQITPPETQVASDTSMLQAGETFSLSELLYPMLLNSSNVAAEAIASSSNRIKFLELMSSYAWEVGMPSSFFADPSGLSPMNESTAKDFFALARYLYNSRPDILSITRTLQALTSTTTDHGAHDFSNIHPFAKDPDFLGGKTGRTPEAGETMLTIMNIKDQPIAIVILGSYVGMREADTRALIEKVKGMM